MYCPNCGNKIPDESNFCLYCGYKINAAASENKQQENASQQTRPQGTPQQVYTYEGEVPQKKSGGCLVWIILLVIIVAVFVFFGSMLWGSDNGSQDSTVQQNTTNTTEQQQEPQMTKKEYKKACKEYDYEKILRKPDKYEGKLAKFTGEVLQVQEYEFLGEKTNYYRVGVTKITYDYINEVTYDDPIYVEYTPGEKESRIIEGDIVTVWGELDGLESYTSIAGFEITIPRMKAKYIKIKKDD